MTFGKREWRAIAVGYGVAFIYAIATKVHWTTVVVSFAVTLAVHQVWGDE